MPCSDRMHRYEMAAVSLWPPSSFDTTLSPSGLSPSAPKRMLSLLLKIQPWGNSKSARLRAMFGLSAPLTAALSPSTQAAEGQLPAVCLAKEAWLAGGDLDYSDGCVVLEVADVQGLPAKLAIPAGTRAPLRSQSACRMSTASGSDDGSSDGGASELGTETTALAPPRAGANPLSVSVRPSSAVVASSPRPSADAVLSLVGPAVAALAEITARRRRKLEGEEQSGHAAANALAEDSSVAVAAAKVTNTSQRGRAHGRRYLTVPREPLHPNWQVGPRRAAIAGSNTRGWLPLHILASAQAQMQAQLALADSPGSSSAAGPDGTGAGSVPTDGGSPTSYPNPSQTLQHHHQHHNQQLSQHQPPARSGSACTSSVVTVSAAGVSAAGAASATSLFQSAAGAAAAVVSVGIGPNSRSSSTHSERALRPQASTGLGGTSQITRVDSFTSSSVSLAALHQATHSALLPYDRDRDDSLGPPHLASMQGGLRGSRMHGHVTAVANPAYVAAAAALPTGPSPPAAAAVVAAAAAGSGALPVGPGVLFREHSRRHRQMQQQLSALDTEAAAAVIDAATTAHHSLPPPVLSVPESPLPTSCATIGDGGNGGVSMGALRHSLAQQREAAPPTNAPRPPPSTTAIVAAGLQGYALTLRPGSPYQPPYQPAYQPNVSNLSQAGVASSDFLSVSPVTSHAPLVASNASGTPTTGLVASGSTPPAVSSAVPWSPGSSHYIGGVKQGARSSSSGGGGGNYSAIHPLATVVAATQQQQQQQQQQPKKLQRPRTGSKQRRPSLTDFGSARAQLQHRPMDGWASVAFDKCTGAGGGSKGSKDMPVSASAPHLVGTWAAAAAAFMADTTVTDGATAATVGTGRQASSSSSLPLSKPILMDAAATSGNLSAATAAAVVASPTGLLARPSSSAAVLGSARPMSSPLGVGAGGLGSCGGGMGGGGGGGGGISWLTGGVSLLQALALGTDGATLHGNGHHHHGHNHQNNHIHHKYHNQHNGHHDGHQRPPRAPLPGGGSSATVNATGGNGGSSGASVLSMAPGRGSGAHRQHGRGGKFH